MVVLFWCLFFWGVAVAGFSYSLHDNKKPRTHVHDAGRLHVEEAERVGRVRRRRCDVAARAHDQQAGFELEAHEQALAGVVDNRQQRCRGRVRVAVAEGDRGAAEL